jgi:FtsZ-binding cell division protein ZapB
METEEIKKELEYLTMEVSGIRMRLLDLENEFDKLKDELQRKGLVK